MKKNKALLLSCLGVFIIHHLSGCASEPKPVPPKPTIVQVSLIASPMINLTAKGRASPVMVRVYGLKSASVFQTANFFTLFDKDKETLGTELLTREELQLVPGQQISLKPLPSPDIQYVGVMAAYRDIEHVQWRALTAIPQHETSNVQIRLEKNTVKVSLDGQE